VVAVRLKLDVVMLEIERERPVNDAPEEIVVMNTPAKNTRTVSIFPIELYAMPLNCWEVHDPVPVGVEHDTVLDNPLLAKGSVAESI
jgi:hypothetical protein